MDESSQFMRWMKMGEAEKKYYEIPNQILGDGFIHYFR